MKVRIKFRKTGNMKFVGHLDFMRYFQKAMKRADIPIAFTKGYSPHMIMSFAHPLGVGLTSDAEYMDIELAKPISSDKATTAINQVMVDGVEVLSFLEIAPEKKHAGMAIVSAADYFVGWDQFPPVPDAAHQIKVFFAQDQIFAIKETKRSEKQVNIRPMIYQLEGVADGIFMKLATGSRENLKPGLVFETFASFINMERPRFITFHRQEIYAEIDSTFVTLEQLGKEIV